MYNSSSRVQRGPSSGTGTPASCRHQHFVLYACPSWRPNPVGLSPAWGLFLSQDSCSWLPELGPRIHPTRGPLSPLVLHAQSLFFLLCFANRRLCWGRSGSDRNELMCLLQAQNWVLSFPGGDGGGGSLLPSLLQWPPFTVSQAAAGPRRLTRLHLISRMPTLMALLGRTLNSLLSF